MDLQIQALKKKTLSNKLNFYAKQEKEKYLNQHPEIKTKKTPVSSTNAKLPAFNFFALFKDTPEKLLDFPFSSSFSQISSAQESTNRHYVLSTIPLSLNTLVRRKKLQHHEETVPLFSRIWEKH